MALTDQPRPDGRHSQTVSRALSVLDLFDAEHPVWPAEDICAALHCPVPTGYRYIRELVAAGLLRRVPGGFALGARIILLDYVMRQADQLLQTALPVMRALTAQTGCDSVLTAVYGDQILDVHRELGTSPLALAYGRGRPRPPFQGAAPKVILAAQPNAWVHKLYDANAEAAAQAGMGRDWKEFRATLAAIRKNGCYVSRGELEPTIDAVAAPIQPHGHEPAAAIAVVMTKERSALFNETVLISLVRQAAEQISTSWTGSG
jgi:DNA-binding IclR family transcriptional regulator